MVIIIFLFCVKYQKGQYCLGIDHTGEYTIPVFKPVLVFLQNVTTNIGVSANIIKKLKNY